MAIVVEKPKQPKHPIILSVDAAPRLSQVAFDGIEKGMRPKPDEVRDMIRHFLNHRKWRLEMIDAAIGTKPGSCRSILCGGKLFRTKSALRALWFLWCMDTCPLRGVNIYHIATWGNSRYELPPSGADPETATRDYLNTARPWLHLDWRKDDETLAGEVGIDSELVWRVRKKLKAHTGSFLRNVFAAAGSQVEFAEGINRSAIYFDEWRREPFGDIAQIHNSPAILDGDGDDPPA